MVVYDVYTYIIIYQQKKMNFINKLFDNKQK